MNAQGPKPLFKRIKPAGWLIIGVVILAAGSACGVIVQPLVYTPQPLAPVATADLPTMTPILPTAAPLPLLPTPQGWATKTDPFSKTYLAPSPEDEKAIREAFDAIMAMLLIVGDSPKDAAAKYDRKAALDKINKLSAIPEWKDVNWNLWSLVIIPSKYWGPQNPIRCDDYKTCTVTQAKIGAANGAVIYDSQLCEQAKLTAPCVISGSMMGEDEAPYKLYTVTVQQEDGIWKAIKLQIQKLQGPPLP